MAENTQEKVARPKTVSWEEWYQASRDELITSKSALETNMALHKYQIEHLPDALGQVQTNVLKSFYTFATWIKELYGQAQTQLEVMDNERNRLRTLETRSTQNETKVTEFLERFQKWMDRYGPMLEAEYQNSLKIQRT